MKGDRKEKHASNKQGASSSLQTFLSDSVSSTYDFLYIILSKSLSVIKLNQSRMFRFTDQAEKLDHHGPTNDNSNPLGGMLA